MQGDGLGGELAKDDDEGCDSREGDHHRHDSCHGFGSEGEQERDGGIDQSREERFPKPADSEACHGDPELRSSNRAIEVLECREEGTGAGLSPGGQLFNARAAHAHERELRGNKEAVDADQRSDNDKANDDHPCIRHEEMIAECAVAGRRLPVVSDLVLCRRSGGLRSWGYGHR